MRGTRSCGRSTSAQNRPFSAILRNSMTSTHSPVPPDKYYLGVHTIVSYGNLRTIPLNCITLFWIHSRISSLCLIQCRVNGPAASATAGGGWAQSLQGGTDQWENLLKMIKNCYSILLLNFSLQFFDIVDWATGRTSGL